MLRNTETLIINGTKDVVETIRDEIDNQPDSKSHISERKNLDGSAATWIVIASLAAQTLPHILGFVKDYLATRKVGKIKFGDIEIENPTPEDIEKFRKMIDEKLNS